MICLIFYQNSFLNFILIDFLIIHHKSYNVDYFNVKAMNNYSFPNHHQDQIPSFPYTNGFFHRLYYEIETNYFIRNRN